jgi:hypothetical protein
MDKLPKPERLRRWHDRTHRCFEMSGQIVTDNPTWTLVHGRIRPILKIAYEVPHAWVKRDGVVYDAVEARSYTVEDYAATRGAVEVATYSVQDLAALLSMGVND